jgi:signal transduction histidine kinase
MALSLRSKAAFSISALLAIQGLMQLSLTLYVVRKETDEVRRRLAGIGLQMLQELGRDGGLDEPSLRRRFGPIAGYVVATYDGEGRRLARSRDDIVTPDRIAGQGLPADGAVHFQGPNFVGHPGLALMRVGELRVGDAVRFIGVLDVRSEQQVLGAIRRGLWVGTGFTLAIALAATWLLWRAIRRRMAQGEALLERLAATALEGADEAPPPAFGDDEVGRLARQFREMADALRSNVVQLRLEQERRRQAFADWTHEVATPLTSVLGYLEALGADDVDADRETRRRYVDIAMDRARALQALTEDLATLSQIDCNELALLREPVDVREILRKEVDAAAPLAGKAQVALELAVEAPVPLELDRARIGQVFRNLLTNAVEHSPPGSHVTIRAEATPSGALVEVRDQGRGIAAEHLASLGQRFFRVDASRDRRTGGRGLGLAIARGLVEGHGGRLVISSELGRGTVAQVVLSR